MRLHPLRQRSRTGQNFTHQPVSVAVGVLVSLLDSDVEVRLDLVHEADVLTRELAPGAFQRAKVYVDEVGAFGIQTTSGQLAPQFTCRAGKFTRIGLRGALDLLTQRRVTGECVDEPVFETVETQSEQQVLANKCVWIHNDRA